MVLFCCEENQYRKEANEAQGKISWLMGTVQRSLFPHLDECLETPLAEQEKRLVTIFEIVQVEKHVHKRASTQWPRNSLISSTTANSFAFASTSTVISRPSQHSGISPESI